MMELGLYDFISPEDAAAIERDVGRATGLPPIIYGDSFFELESRKLFPRQWCAAGFVSDIPSPGDAVAADVAGWQLVFVRGEDNRIRGFHNVCRHRGVNLVEGRCEKLRALVCPWHGWVYGLDGKLARTPRIAGGRGHEDPLFDSLGLDLKEVQVGTWLNMIFVNMAGNAEPLSEHLKGLNAILDPELDFSDLEVGGQWSIDYPGNWKVTVEGAIEDYHLLVCHAQFVKGAVERDLKMDFRHEPERFFLMAPRRVYENSAKGGQAAVTQAGLPSLLRDENVEVPAYFVNVFPSGFLSIRPNHVVAGVVLPAGHRKTTLTFRFLYKAAAAHDPRYAPDREALETMWKQVFPQDMGYVKAFQRNAEQPGDTGIRQRFSPYWEPNVVHFQQTIVRALRDTSSHNHSAAE